MTWLQTVLSGESKIRSEIDELARQSRDETLSPAERLKAMFELGMVIQAGEELQEMANQLNEEVAEPKAAEPKSKWVKGARVRQ